MLAAIYNARSLPMTILPRLRGCLVSLALLVLSSAWATANDWAEPERLLARKIAAITGPGAAALTVENHSTLTPKEVEAVRAGLRVNLESLGLHLVDPEQAAALVSVVLSENPQSYVWTAVASVGQKSFTTLISAPRLERTSLQSETFAITLRKTLLWEQSQPILDIAVLEQKTVAAEIAVLDSDGLAFYGQRSGKWALEQKLPIPHTHPWPRDLRGRLLVARDSMIEAYLPGTRCHTVKHSGLTLECRDNDDPWPIGGTPGVSAVPPQSAFFAAKRNFFTGDLTPHIGKFSTVPRFYSAAALPRDGYVLWLLAGTDGLLHMVDGLSDQPSKSGWGSDLVAVKSSCGTGWTVLTTGNGTRPGDFVRAYELLDREPVPVSLPMEFGGSITALWTASDEQSAVVASSNRETGKYEAYRLQVVCGQ